MHRRFCDPKQAQGFARRRQRKLFRVEENGCRKGLGLEGMGPTDGAGSHLRERLRDRDKGRGWSMKSGHKLARPPSECLKDPPSLGQQR